MTTFTTIQRLNSVKSSGIDNEFVRAIFAIWHLQAATDPNTQASAQLSANVLGTMEDLIIDEVSMVDVDLSVRMRQRAAASDRGAFITDEQIPYTEGKTQVDAFTAEHGHQQIMMLVGHFADIAISVSKNPEATHVLSLIYNGIDQLCEIADQEEGSFKF